VGGAFPEIGEPTTHVPFAINRNFHGCSFRIQTMYSIGGRMFESRAENRRFQIWDFRFQRKTYERMRDSPRMRPERENRASPRSEWTFLMTRVANRGPTVLQSRSQFQQALNQGFQFRAVAWWSHFGRLRKLSAEGETWRKQGCNLSLLSLLVSEVTSRWANLGWKSMTQP